VDMCTSLWLTLNGETRNNRNLKNLSSFQIKYEILRCAFLK
jgi:hypothetical protein